jgi:hypothetical protein
MELTKRTYALPSQTIERFEGKIAPGKRSAKVAELIEAWISAQELEALRRDIIEGCRDMNEIDLALVKDWEATDDELWRDIEP